MYINDVKVIAKREYFMAETNYLNIVLFFYE